MGQTHDKKEPLHGRIMGCNVLSSSQLKKAKHLLAIFIDMLCTIGPHSIESDLGNYNRRFFDAGLYTMREHHQITTDKVYDYMNVTQYGIGDLDDFSDSELVRLKSCVNADFNLSVLKLSYADYLESINWEHTQYCLLLYHSQKKMIVYDMLKSKCKDKNVLFIPLNVYRMPYTNRTAAQLAERVCRGLDIPYSEEQFNEILYNWL